MYCKSCGKEVEEGAKFCSGCGTKNEEIAVAEVKSAEAEAPASAGTMEQLCLECKGKGKKFSMMKVLVKVILAVMILFFVAQGGNVIAGLVFLGAMIYDGAARKCKVCNGTGKVATTINLR